MVHLPLRIITILHLIKDMVELPLTVDHHNLHQVLMPHHQDLLKHHTGDLQMELLTLTLMHLLKGMLLRHKDMSLNKV